MMLWAPILLAAVLCIAIVVRASYSIIATLGLMLIPASVFVLSMLYLDTSTVFLMFCFTVLILMFAD